MGKTGNQLKLTYGLFAVYFLALVWAVLFKMQVSFETLPHFRGLNLIPFAGSVVRNGRMDYNEIILNMLVFIPFGLYLSMLRPSWPFWKRILPIAGVSVLFELLQYLFAIGGADITDLLGNTLGGAVGIGLYRVLLKILKARTNRILNILALTATLCVIVLGILVSRVVIFRF